jgi:hypothetical protein
VKSQQNKARNKKQKNESDERRIKIPSSQPVFYWQLSSFLPFLQIPALLPLFLATILQWKEMG